MGEKNGSKIKTFERTIRRRVECEEKAFHVVNNLIDDKVADDYLIQCAKFITKENYKDINEERAISNLCGYPLCNKTLQNIPKKKYHISTKSNKVYDITERKNFCSNQCFKASEAFHLQISDSPVWAREHESNEEITLLPHRTTRGLLGEEVIGVSPKKVLEEEISLLKELDEKSKATDAMMTGQSLKHVGRKDCLPSGKTPEREGYATVDDVKTRTSDDIPSLSVKQPERTSVEKVDSQGHQDEVQDGLITKVKEMSLEDHPKATINEDRRGHVRGSNSVSQEVSQDIGSQVRTVNSESHGVVLEPCKDRVEAKVDKEKNSQTNSISSESSKMVLLKKLLAEKKSVLSQMTDVQEIIVSPSQTQSSEVAESDSVTENVSEKDGRLSATSEESKSGSHFSRKIQSDNEKDLSNPHHRSTSASSVSQTVTTPPSDLPTRNTFRRKNTLQPRTPLHHIGQILKAWTSESTRTFLQQSNSSSSVNNEAPLNFSHPQIQRGYTDLCKRLESQETEFNDIFEIDQSGNSAESARTKLKGAPDYKILQKESQEFNLKVTEFITGKHQKDVGKTEEKPDDDNVYIPPVDAYNQKQIRIKIVLEKLDKALPDVLGPLQLSVQDVSTLIRGLTYTFKLDKDNIVLKPPEWILVSLCILKMLALKCQSIDEAFKGDSATRHFSVFLRSIGHTMEDVNSLLEHIVS